MKISKDNQLDEYQKSSYKPLIPYDELSGRSRDKKRSECNLRVSGQKEKEYKLSEYYLTSTPQNHNISFQIKNKDSAQGLEDYFIRSREKERSQLKSPIEKSRSPKVFNQNCKNE